LNSLPPFAAANTNESDHPALESIAAYLDGQLPEAERPALAAHLDTCAPCYEIYSESLRFQKEESAEARRGVLPFKRRKSWIPPNLLRNIALPVAALLVVGVGAGVWRQLHLPLKQRSVDSFTARLSKPNALMTENLGPFDTNRGVPEVPTVNYPVVAFQSGATLVDLRVAIEANDPEKIGLLAQNLGVLYNNGVLFPEEKEKREVEVAVNRFQEGDTSPKMNEVRLSALHSLERILRSTNPEPLAPHFQLGAWTEAGRLAVYGEKTEFFADPENRKSLQWFRRNPPKPEVKAALDRIEDAWPEGSFTPSVKENLTEQFDEVIVPYNVSLTLE